MFVKLFKMASEEKLFNVHKTWIERNKMTFIFCKIKHLFLCDIIKPPLLTVFHAGCREPQTPLPWGRDSVAR